MNLFKLGRFEFTIVARDGLHLPEYKGSTFRGGFGAAFKKVVCVVREGDCATCVLRQKCVYSYVFETPLPGDAKLLRRYPYAPHPFVIEPPAEERKEYRQGDELTFNVVLIGQAIDYLPYFVYTFDELGKRGVGRGRGRYHLKEVKDVGEEGEGQVIFIGREKVLQSNFRIITGEEILRECEGHAGVRSITFEFLTPTRIRYQGHLVKDVEFHILLRSLLRRISLLSYFHCGAELELDFRGLVERAGQVEVGSRELDWYDWERYSKRQDVRMKMGGFVGEVTFVGDLEDFLPFILLGSYIHVGKGTAFGLGKYRIEGRGLLTTSPKPAI
ncbi:MAG TPA: CRISPR system precrRNA processing endoribonuclease RAMP protein Cas6 [Candidatus Latescibacteria bacterium]|nr:CRISPR system precrRNA processing endoribonuclease RAMP protein Cas6 [Candidatus Latescibacterota bacterium]